MVLPPAAAHPVPANRRRSPPVENIIVIKVARDVPPRCSGIRRLPDAARPGLVIVGEAAWRRGDIERVDSGRIDRDEIVVRKRRRRSRSHEVGKGIDGQDRNFGYPGFSIVEKGVHLKGDLRDIVRYVKDRLIHPPFRMHYRTGDWIDVITDKRREADAATTGVLHVGPDVERPSLTARSSHPYGNLVQLVTVLGRDRDRPPHSARGGVARNDGHHLDRAPGPGRNLWSVADPRDRGGVPDITPAFGRPTASGFRELSFVAIESIDQQVRSLSTVRCCPGISPVRALVNSPAPRLGIL